MICKLTGKEGEGVKSHLIPKSFHCISDTASLIISNKEHPKRSRIGLYDNEIVTAEGEAILEKLDDYGNKLLIDGREKLKPFVLEGQTLGLGLDEYDYVKLKLFCLSILWRMSVSSRSEVVLVHLGPHENIIKNMITSFDAGTPDKYSVVLFRYTEENLQGAMLYPARERIVGINFYRLYFSDYTALIKIDCRRTLTPFNNSMQLAPNSPLLIADRSFSKSSEAKLFQKLLSSNTNKNELPKWFVDAANKPKGK